MEEKWHKNCGGRVVYREPDQIKAGFGEAGFCLKCDAFPIVQEDIIFKLELSGKYERLTNNEWKIFRREDLPETLDD